MNTRPIKFAVLIAAVTTACLAPGCSNSANESGNGSSSVGQGEANPNAPKDMGDYYKQRTEKEAAAKAQKGSRAGK